MTSDPYIETSLTDVGVRVRSQQSCQPRVFCVLAHGAGAGMDHPFLEKLAEGLLARRVSVLRFNFPFIDRGGFPPDRLPVLLAAADAVLEYAEAEAGGLPLFVVGKSLGGRVLSLSAASRMPSSLRGFAFCGYPLHSEKRQGITKGEHLKAIMLPMLFLSGTRDRLAHREILEPFVESLGSQATMRWFEGADHGFTYRRKDLPPPDDVTAVLAAMIERWMMECLGINPVDSAK